MGTEKSCT
jgi:hypothetical protein